MRINLIVYGGVYSSQAGYSAYQFAKAALVEHQITQVFFYQDGVTQANRLNQPLADEFNSTEAWARLADEHQIELVVCVSAAERRGVIDAAQQADLDKDTQNCHPAFSIQGLGTMMDATLSAQRTVTFK